MFHWNEFVLFFWGIPMKRLTCTLALLSILSLVGCGGGNSAGPPMPTLQSISVTPAAPSVVVPATQQFTATGSYSDGSSKNLTASVTWSSSDSSKATIAAGGLATSVAATTTPVTITATSGGISGSTTLTVQPKLVSLAVTPASVTIAATTQTSFTAMGTYSDGSVQNVTSTVTWSSSDATVATISNGVSTQGTATGVAAGTVTITATSSAISGSITGTATLKVTSATLVSIAVTPAGMSIPLGVQQQFTATGTFSDSTTQNITGTVTWASSASTIASITVSGLATGLKLGSTNINATAGAVSGTTSLTVNAANLASLAVTPGNVTVAANTSQQFTAIGTFNDGGTKNLTGSVTWASSVPAVATIGVGNGVAKALTSGTTMISATISSTTTTVTLTVSTATVTSISVTPSGRTIAPGTKLPLTATAAFSDSTSQVVTPDATWSSDNTSFATVNTVGVATGIGAGAANISAALGGQTGSATLKVSSATLTLLAITPSSAVLAPASTLNYQAVGTYSDGSTQNITNVVTWTSLAPSVAKISASGVATGQSAGTTTIMAALGSVSNTSNVVVEASALQSIVVTPATTTIPAQVGSQYTATGHFADGMTQDLTSSVTWTSSSPSVATISNSAGSSGLAVGVAPGSSNITAAFAGVVGTATLNVNSAMLSSIIVTPGSATIPSNGSQQFTANGHFNDGSVFNVTGQVTWTSSNVNFAVISGGGLANGVAAGTSTITATLGSTNGTATLTVQ